MKCSTFSAADRPGTLWLLARGDVILPSTIGEFYQTGRRRRRTRKREKKAAVRRVVPRYLEKENRNREKWGSRWRMRKNLSFYSRRKTLQRHGSMTEECWDGMLDLSRGHRGR